MREKAENLYRQVSYLSIQELRDYGELIEASLHLEGEDDKAFRKAWDAIMSREKVARMRWK